MHTCELYENEEDMEEVKEVAASIVKYPSSSIFTWIIHNFSQIENDKYSDIFLVGGCEWRLRIYPKRCKDDDHFSLYLEVPNPEGLPDGWSRDVKYGLAVIDQLHSESTKRLESPDEFSAESPSWGYRKFMSLSVLNDPARGYIVNDTCIVEATVALGSVVPKTEGASFKSMVADVKECHDCFIFMVDIPGVNPENIKIQVVNKALLIQGEQISETEEGVTYLTNERKIGTFRRSFTLPENTNADAISAVHKYGVLIVTVGKLAPQKPKTVPIKIT